MRLTKKTENGYGSVELLNKPKDPLYPITPFVLDKVWEKQRNKLGQLEDIEDELGIDLITLFKALNIGVYYYKKRMNFAKAYRIKLRISDKMVYIDKHIHLYFKDYGITWSLDKKELKK